MNRSSFILSAILAGLFVPAAFFAQSSDEKLPPEAAVQETVPEQEENELNVTAERMEVLLDGRSIELTGNVRFEDNSMILTANRMIIFLDENLNLGTDEKAPKENEKDKSDQNSPEQSLKRIEAYGNVILAKKQDRTESAMGNTAVFDAKTNLVTLSGDCVIKQQDRTLKGKEVIFDRQNGKISVTGIDLRIKLKKGQNGGFDNLFESKNKQPKAQAPDKNDGNTPKKDDENPPKTDDTLKDVQEKGQH